MEESVSFGVVDHPGVDQFGSQDPGVDECGPRPMGGPTSRYQPDLSSRGLDGIVRHTMSSDRMFTTPSSREISFQNWPSSLNQKPPTLADAGFYYIGISDHVKCFTCSLGLRDWEDADCPWKEHAKYSPSCSFIRLAKGDEFIQMAARELQLQRQESLGDSYQNSYHEEVIPMSTVSSTYISTSGSSPEDSFQPAPGSGSSLTASSSRSAVQSPTASPVVLSSEPPPVLSLEDENERLRDQKLCKICWTGEVGVTFIPCGHLVCCINCSLAVSVCPLCRSNIQGSVRTFMS